ncbi:bicyclomycin resistance protein [Rutstroemia sp. NJR-2017a BBW]|nr:bicyclomycin resistance protein [Rutstroemia sp. NJR-2017a BBW]
MLMLTNFGTITIVPAVPQVMEEFHKTNDLYSTILVSIWELGEVFGPLVVDHIGNILFILCCTASALSTNMAMLIVFRFLNGFVISSVTLGPSIAGDLFRKEERGTAMSIAIALPLMGPFAAPVVGSYIADAKGWRWTIWIVVIAVGAVTCVACLLFRETYKVKILQRKTERLRKLTGNELLRSRYEDATKRGTFAVSLKRPLKMLFFSPIVFIITFFTSLVYGISYLILTTLTQVMEKNYGFGQGPIGLAFLGRAVGNITGMIVYGLFSDRYIRYKKSQEGYMKPEHRLPLMLLGAIVLPAGLFLYGWSAEKHLHWIVPLIGTAIVGFSMLLALLPTDNYLVDVYDIHGASAVAVGAALHAVFAAILPLVGPPLYNHLGLGWGNSVLAFISIVFLPALLVLIRYGERIRNSPRFKQDL